MTSKPCAECGKSIIDKPHHLPHRTYCSRPCMSKGYAERMKGASNPHFSAAGNRTCQQCGVTFQHYNKARKFCSDRCKGLAPGNVEKLRSLIGLPRKPRAKLGRRCECKRCGVEFRWPEKKSYCPTHHDTRFDDRAGGTKDRNHDAIVATLLAAGAGIIDTHHQGGGMPDLVVSNGQRLMLFEVKNPGNGYGRRGLSPSQRRWADAWQGPAPVIVRTPAEALAAFHGDLVPVPSRFDTGEP